MPWVITAVGQSGFDPVYLYLLYTQIVQFWEWHLGFPNTFLHRGEALWHMDTPNFILWQHSQWDCWGVLCQELDTMIPVDPFQLGCSMILWSPSPPWENLILCPSVRLAAHATTQKTPAFMEKDKGVTLKLHPRIHIPQHQWNISSYPEVSALKALDKGRSEIRASQAFSCR